MGASEIKAGSAYVEIGGKTKPLDDALNAASKKIKEFGAGMQTLGASLSAAGVAMLAPLALSAKAFADYGENIGKLASKTGMSTEQLSGLAYAAKASNISMSAISGAVRFMQRNISGGSKEAQSAFRELGFSISELKDGDIDQFTTLADAVSNIEDPGKRAAMAMNVFGKSGVELLPIIENGAEELQRLQREAKLLGLVLGPEASEAAAKLDTAFDRLGGATEGLKLHIGAALAPMLTQAVNRVIDIVIAAQEWIDQNPELVESFAKTAVVIAIAGAGIAALGVAVAALMSPVVLVTGVIIGIGAAVLAVTDTLGVTETGFGELFDSIRIGGFGLGTWFAVFFKNLQQAWNNLTANIHYSWARTWLALKIIGYSFADFFLGVIQKMLEAVGKLNGVSKFVGVDLSGATEIANGIGVQRQGRDAEIQKDRFAAEKILGDRDLRNDQSDKEIKGLFDKGGYDGTTGVHVDISKARAALGKIGDNIWNTLETSLGKFLSGVPETPFEDQKKKETAEGAAPPKPQLSVVGSFSAYAGGNLSAQGVFQQQLQESKNQTEHLKNIDRKMSSGGSFGVGG